VGYEEDARQRQRIGGLVIADRLVVVGDCSCYNRILGLLVGVVVGAGNDRMAVAEHPKMIQPPAAPALG